MSEDIIRKEQPNVESVKEAGASAESAPELKTEDFAAQTAQRDSSEPAVEASDEPVALKGHTVFAGTAFGHAQLLTEGELEIPHFTIDKSDTRGEFNRLRGAVNTVAREFQELLDEDDAEEMPGEARAFIELHRQILQDESLITDTQGIIRERLINAEWALSIRLEDLRRSFEEIDDEYLAERIVDIAQVIERVQRVLTGRRRPCDTVQQVMSDSAVILIAEELSPADILILRRRADISVAGLVVELGSPTAHASILARSLEIPMLVNVEGVRELVRTDDEILLDATNGTVTIHPKPEAIPAGARMGHKAARRRRYLQLRNTPCATADGVRVSLFANIALPEDVSDAVKNGAEGIGLFRSEFLFMNRPVLPTEDEQYETYLRVIRAMKGRPVTIRTMDLGGDKQLSEEALSALGEDVEELVSNPALGRRAIRFCVDHPELFKTQLRAILRAAVEGNVRIMLPLLSRLSEIHYVRRVLAECLEELRDRGVKHAERIPVGGMIEVPAVAYCLPNFLKCLDFASIGTNDLVQYLLAVDRQDPSVSALCNPLHPAVILVLSDMISAANRAGKEIGVCGEAASDPLFAKMLVGMGLRTLSMDCSSLLPVKECMLGYTLKEAQDFARKLKRARSAPDVQRIVARICDPEKDIPLSPIMRSALTEEFLGLDRLTA